MLDVGSGNGLSLSNLALQKLLYFAHGFHVIETGAPLVSGYFEAWQYGPVHPAAYQAFRSAGDQPIGFRCERLDILTGHRFPIEPPKAPAVRQLVNRVLSHFGPMTAGRLVDISHAKGAPWHYVVDKGGTTMALGLRISDAVIRERFRYHKVSVGLEPTIGEPREDAPFVA